MTVQKILWYKKNLENLLGDKEVAIGNGKKTKDRRRLIQ